MKSSSTGSQLRVERGPRASAAPADVEASFRRTRRGALARFTALPRLASVFACAGALTTGATARAQGADGGSADGDAKTVLAQADVDEMLRQAEAEEGASRPGAQSAPGTESPPATAVSPSDAAAESEGEAPEDEVVVTGYRRSLGLALRKKQMATGQLDAIVADDIADFPDQNLAEALQRIPGVSIARQNGEGNRITVRGLSGLYTRTRVNGMEARGSIGNNSTREFDFNLFASELFNSIVIQKTASANVEEGSLGATVDLNTARAFDYKPGLTAVANAVGAYNDLSEAVTPRVTGLVAYNDPAGLWGAAVSAAYQGVRLDTVSTDTVAWQRAPFRSVNGVVCTEVENDPGCLEANDAFHPRIPRFGQDELRGDRLGLTGGFQLHPGPSTEIRLDGLYALYDWEQTQRRLFPLIRNNEGQTDLYDYTLITRPDRFGVGNDSLIAGTLDNAWIRSENVRNEVEARFQQLTLAFDHDFTGSVYLRALAGISRSRSGAPHETTLNYDNRSYDGYRFDLTDDEAPVYAFEGPDVTDPANFVVPEVRDRVGTRLGGFDTAQVNLHYDVDTPLNFVAGVSAKRSTYERRDANRDGGVCDLGLYDCDTNGDGEPDVLGPTGDLDSTTQLEYRGDVGAGSATRWAVPDADSWVQAFGYYDAPLSDNVGREEIIETNLGGFLQARGEVGLGAGGMRLLYDAGLRYVQTLQTSRGLIPEGEEQVLQVIDRDYGDWLPSANAALWLNEELVFRLSAARVMSRPVLAYLSPSTGVDSFGYTINSQNPYLDPTRANAVDLAMEWYFSDDSVLSLAGFYKDIESFPTQESRVGTFASTGLPQTALIDLSPAAESPNGEGNCNNPDGCWNITQRVNGPGASVKGFEVGFQAPFRAFASELPVVVRDMGFVANYTYVDAEAQYDFFGNEVSERLVGLSNSSVNTTLYYDDSTFSARASLAYRSDFLANGPNNQGNLWVITEPNARIDASSSYNVTDQLRISLEALNITDSAFSNVLDIDASRRGVYNRFGRTIFLGARYSLN